MVIGWARLQIIYMPDIININNTQIGIHEYGDKNGFPVFYFHGFPGSRLDGYILNFKEHIKNGNFRVIAVDRPGIGLSDYQPERKLLDWSDDMARIADKLNINTFSVIGFSGGAPYTLSCASGIPDRIHSVGFISGMGPIDFKESKKDNAMLIPRQIPLIRRLIASSLYKSVRNNPGKISRNMRRILPRADVEYFSQDGNIDKIQLLFSENLKQGVKGFLQEAEIYRQPWGFKLSAIKTRVHLWQGTEDRNISVRSARRLSQEIPDCKASFIQGEGHFSLIGKYLNNILRELP
jgi:pimeloyl-ACP methyl ester carboxylesterase